MTEIHRGNIELTIAKSGTDATPDMHPGRSKVIGFRMDPDGWDAADLQIQGALTADGTFEDIYDSAGNQLTLTVDSDRKVYLTAAQVLALLPWPYVRLVASAAQNTAARTLYAMTIPIETPI